ncbi:unnamed protein product [Pedinophyceae sp. YPF-701]|nr:unnamed protein product [Pedinophyceae sp. YPF-701]
MWGFPGKKHGKERVHLKLEDMLAEVLGARDAAPDGKRQEESSPSAAKEERSDGVAESGTQYHQHIVDSSDKFLLDVQDTIDKFGEAAEREVSRWNRKAREAHDKHRQLAEKSAREVFGKVYQQFLDQAGAASPEIRARGRVIGDMILDELYSSILGMERRKPAQKAEAAVAPSGGPERVSTQPQEGGQYLGRAADGEAEWLAEPSDWESQAQKLHGDRDSRTKNGGASKGEKGAGGGGEGAGEGAQGVDGGKEEDTPLLFNMVAPWTDPVLGPFVEGLWEPFDEQVQGIKRTIVVAGATLSVTCLATGFFLGYLKGRSDRNNK